MLAGRLVSGPSRTVFQRFLASPAYAPAPDASVASPEPIPPRPTTSSESARLPPAKPRLTTSPERVKDLIAAASQNPQTSQSRRSTWTIFRSLSPAQRAGLPSSYLRTVLAALVPKYDEAWRVVQTSDNRSRLAHNRKLGQQWEKRLRAVMSDLVVRNDATLDDWLVVMRSFMRVGYVSACESVVNELPREHRQHVTVLETRLGTIVRWLRNLDLKGFKPTSADIEIAHAAFWEVFRDIQDNRLEVSAFTLRLLLQASSELSNMIGELEADDSIARFDEVLRYVFLNGYGMDLDNLPASVEERALDKSRTFPLLSSNALNATLSQLRRRGTNAHQLVAMFELLTERPKVASNVGSSRAFDDEDEEDFIPTLSSQTAAEEASGEKRNWMGFKVAPKAEFFDHAAPPASEGSSESSSAATMVDEAQLQKVRHIRDYLPELIFPSKVSAAPTFAPPSKNTWDSNTIVILLQAAGQGAKRYPDASRRVERNFMQAILELGVHDVMTHNAAWLSAYLACPESAHRHLKRPHRISPEWFRYVLARQMDNNMRGAARTRRLLQEVIQWNQEMIEVLTAREAERAGQPLPEIDGRIQVPFPDSLCSKHRIRKWRNAGNFIVSDEVQSLYDDQEKLRGHLQNAEKLATKRREQVRLRHERRIATGAAVESGAQRAS